MDIGQGHYDSLLPLNLRQALAEAIRRLIDSGFKDLCQVQDVPEMLLETDLMVHLPGRFLKRYTPDVLRRFLVCVIIVAYKFTESDRIELTCVGEALAAHAIITEAELVLDSRRQGLQFEQHFDAFEALLFQQIDIRKLFDSELYQVDDSKLDEMLSAAGLEFESWFRTSSSVSQRGGALHPYLWDAAE